MAYFFDPYDANFSGAPCLSYERDGVLFYICASDESGSFGLGAISDGTPLCTFAEIDADAAAELAGRLFLLPRVPESQLKKLRDAAMDYWA